MDENMSTNGEQQQTDRERRKQTPRVLLGVAMYSVDVRPACGQVSGATGVDLARLLVQGHHQSGGWEGMWQIGGRLEGLNQHRCTGAVVQIVFLSESGSGTVRDERLVEMGRGGLVAELGRRRHKSANCGSCTRHPIASGGGSVSVYVA